MGRIVLPLITAVAVMILVFGLTGRLYSQQGQDTKIGVVDLQQVSTRFGKWIRLAKRLEEENAASNKKLEEMAKKIADLEREQKQFEPGSKRHTEIQIELSTKKIEGQTFYENEQKRLKGMAETLGGELLDNIEKIIQQYGRDNGFTLIIKKEEVATQGRDWAELRSYVNRKAVMYYAANIDITEKIVQILNEKHK